MYSFIKKFIKEMFSKKETRFLFVGVLNTIVGFGSYSLLYFIGIPYLISNVLSTIIGVFHSYLWNKFFTFKSAKKSLSELVRFCTVYVVSFLVSSCTLYILVTTLHMNAYIGGFFNIFITTLISWFGHNFYSFRQKHA